MDAYSGLHVAHGLEFGHLIYGIADSDRKVNTSSWETQSLTKVTTPSWFSYSSVALKVNQQFFQFKTGFEQLL